MKKENQETGFSNPQKSLNPNAFAKLHGIGRDKVMRWIRSGRLSAIDVADKDSKWPRYRIPAEAQVAFIKATTVISAEPPTIKLSLVRKGIRRRRR